MHLHISGVPQTHHVGANPQYEYYRRELVQKARDYRLANRGGGAVAEYTLPPGKAAYPYHYHLKDEESFLIQSGTGRLRTPSGERDVAAGDFLFFPTGEAGAHTLTNASATEPLVYIDFDATHDLDVCFYPDSGKIGVWGMDVNALYKTAQAVAYYEGE